MSLDEPLDQVCRFDAYSKKSNEANFTQFNEWRRAINLANLSDRSLDDNANIIEELSVSSNWKLRVLMGACGVISSRNQLNAASKKSFLVVFFDQIGNIFQISIFFAIAWICYVVVQRTGFFVQCLNSHNIQKSKCRDTYASDLITYAIFFLQAISTRVSSLAVQSRLKTGFQKKACEEYVFIMRKKLLYIFVFWSLSNLLFLGSWTGCYEHVLRLDDYKTRRMLYRLQIGTISQSFLLCPALAFILTDASVAECLVDNIIDDAKRVMLTDDTYWSHKKVLKRINEKSFWLTGQSIIVTLINMICSIVLLFIPYYYYCDHGATKNWNPYYFQKQTCSISLMGSADVFDFVALFVQIFSRDFLLLGMICWGIVKINEKGRKLTHAVLESMHPENRKRANSHSGPNDDEVKRSLSVIEEGNDEVETSTLSGLLSNPFSASLSDKSLERHFTVSTDLHIAGLQEPFRRLSNISVESLPTEHSRETDQVVQRKHRVPTLQLCVSVACSPIQYRIPFIGILTWEMVVVRALALVFSALTGIANVYIRFN